MEQQNQPNIPEASNTPTAYNEAALPEQAAQQKEQPARIDAEELAVQASQSIPAVDPIATVDDSSVKVDDTTDANVPSVAEDVDVIEKVWVDKAKQIVSTTKDDPYEQERQANILQAEYLKKRYGKDLELAA